jgi:hydrogenase nickel incorporation protein HypA/HybF
LGRQQLRRSRLMPLKDRLMHELSIAMSIVDMALEEAERRDVAIDAVHLELGPLSGVAAEALRFSYEIACSGTVLEGSRLVIKEVPIEVYCPGCNAQKTLSSMQWFCCPDCGAPTSEVIHGKELLITALEIRDECRTASVGSA